MEEKKEKERFPSLLICSSLENAGAVKDVYHRWQSMGWEEDNMYYF